MSDFWQATLLSKLKGVGATTADKLLRLGLRHLQDLVFHLPARYQDRTRLTPIGAAQLDSEALLQGTIELADVSFRKRRTLLCRVSDGTGAITLRFFHFSQAQQQQLAKGNQIRFFGEVRLIGGKKEIIHPEYTIIEDPALPVEQTLTPIYPTTEGISQHLLRKLTDQALALLDGAHPIKELIPEALLEEGMAGQQWPSLKDALRITHRPPPDISVSALLDGSHPAQRRLALEELLAHHLSMLKVRNRTKQAAAVPFTLHNDAVATFLQSLPFALTQAQQNVGADIAADMQQPHPMLRLVQGDVGSGKTVVAAIAALHALANGVQVALMAPTEILAEQHFQQFSTWFKPLNIEPCWLSGKIKGKARAATLAGIHDGSYTLIIGTHALFQDEVAYHNLGLVIIDEQHRFGVHQRMSLNQKGEQQGTVPHQLIMTATPIPRTLAMSAYADLDTSVIDELPPGRIPVTTAVIDNQRREQVIERVRNTCKNNHQVYWVCTLIEESEALQCQAAEDTQQQLQSVLPNLNVGLVHGRMKAAEKSAVMADFTDNKLHVLVATTVIEVGVNVPNANVMIIENPERLGLAQLHQLRGRVGRGSDASFCVLLYQTPLSQHAKARLEIMRTTEDGFAIAEEDLRLRGPGEVLGTRQTGSVGLRIADLLRDEDLLERVHTLAAVMTQHHPEHIAPLVNRWLGTNAAYANV